MKIARNRIVLSIPHTSAELRAMLETARATDDRRNVRDLENRLQVKLAEEAGGVPTTLQNRCVCRYSYEGLDGWYFSPWGAAAAFLLLNTLAVVFGASVAAWVPEQAVAAIVAVLFGFFGVHAFLTQPDEPSEELPARQVSSVFLTTLSLIFLAEFGDKTQLAVAGLASNMPLLPIWLGATTALIAISALGVWVGRTLLQRIQTVWLHRAGGAIFLVFAIVAGWQALA